MRLCRKILWISFKEKSIFRFDYITGSVFAFFYIVLKVCLWKGLYGTISSNLLLPMGLKKYIFIQSVAHSLFHTAYRMAPSVAAAMLVFGLHFGIRPGNLFLYLCSVCMGIVINFLYSFLFGSSVIWLRNSFFLDNINSVLFSLFSGAFVPIWFFPEGLKAVSAFLPFRYVVFEPTAIFVNAKSLEESAAVLVMQLMWIILLFGAAALVWNRGRYKIMIQGG